MFRSCPCAKVHVTMSLAVGQGGPLIGAAMGPTVTALVLLMCRQILTGKCAGRMAPLVVAR